jgi:hypothetical protein
VGHDYQLARNGAVSQPGKSNQSERGNIVVGFSIVDVTVSIQAPLTNAWHPQSSLMGYTEHHLVGGGAVTDYDETIPGGKKIFQAWISGVFPRMPQPVTIPSLYLCRKYMCWQHLFVLLPIKV